MIPTTEQLWEALDLLERRGLRAADATELRIEEGRLKAVLVRAALPGSPKATFVMELRP